MAQEISTSPAEAKLPALPSVSHGVKKRMSAYQQTYAIAIDGAAVQRKLGKLIDIGQFASMTAWETRILAAADAQREIALERGGEGTAEELVGTPDDRTHFRRVVTGLVGWAQDAGYAKVVLRCRIRSGHPSLKGCEDALNGGALVIATQEGWNTDDLPVFVAEGRGLDQGQKGGNDPELLAAAKALADKYRLPAPTEA